MRSELAVANFRRILLVNWLLTGPLLLLFAWPYWVVVGNLPGAALFALPFALTILHGHISLAVGDAHRNAFFRWHRNSGFPWNWAFHPALFRLRVRFILFTTSLIFAWF